MSRLQNSQYILMKSAGSFQTPHCQSLQLPSTTSTGTPCQSNFSLSFCIYLVQSRSLYAICWHLKATEVSRFPMVSCSLTYIFNTLLLYLAVVCHETTNSKSSFNQIMFLATECRSWSCILEVSTTKWWGNVTRKAWFFCWWWWILGNTSFSTDMLTSIYFLLLQQPWWKLREAINPQ